MKDKTDLIFFCRRIIGGTIAGLVSNMADLSATLFIYLVGGIIGGIIAELVTDKTDLSATIF